MMEFKINWKERPNHVVAVVGKAQDEISISKRDTQYCLPLQLHAE
jgi:hypothetical protein